MFHLRRAIASQWIYKTESSCAIPDGYEMPLIGCVGSSSCILSTIYLFRYFFKCDKKPAVVFALPRGLCFSEVDLLDKIRGFQICGGIFFARTEVVTACKDNDLFRNSPKHISEIFKCRLYCQVSFC